MRTAIRLLIAAVLGHAAAAGAQDGAALPAPAADYLERAAAQGSWSQVSATYLSHMSASQTRYPATSEAEPAARLALGDASVALTGLLLGDLASSGRVRLDDPISRYLPDGFACADARVCAIGLQELAMQTSGLPPLPTNLFPSDPADPWRDYREADLLTFLANYRLPAQPLPRESPLGNLLLAWLLGRAHGDGYATALRVRVSNPLGLRDTGVDGDSGPSALPARVRSSSEDLARLLRAMLRPGESPLRAALMLSRQPRDSRANWGLGWRITTVRAEEQEWPLVWQSAQLGGETVFVGFRTDQQQAVALSANGAASLAPLGLALLRAGALPPLPPAPAAASFDPAEFAGLYEFTPGAQLVIRPSASGLSAQISGRLALRLTPLAPDLFAVDGAAIRLSFQRDARGRIDALRWSENGVIVPVRRLSARAPMLPRSEAATSPSMRM